MCTWSGSVIQGGAMTEGWETHLKAGHSQLRQTVHIRTQDFVFPNFQWLSAPYKTEKEKEKWWVKRQRRKREGEKNVSLFWTSVQKERLKTIWAFDLAFLFLWSPLLGSSTHSPFWRSWKKISPDHGSLIKMNEKLNECFRVFRSSYDLFPLFLEISTLGSYTNNLLLVSINMCISENTYLQ